MRLPVLLIAGALLLGGCSSSPDQSEPSATVATSSAAAATGDLANYTVSTDTTKKPDITIAAGAGNVTQLLVSDIVKGTGTAVQAGDAVTVHYVGIGALSRKQFDASWDRGEPFSSSLSGLILGWQQGLVGMQVGGRRLLVIPADQAYGDTIDPNGGFGAGETLVFVVDLVSIP